MGEAELAMEKRPGTKKHHTPSMGNLALGIGYLGQEEDSKDDARHILRSLKFGEKMESDFIAANNGAMSCWGARRARSQGTAAENEPRGAACSRREYRAHAPFEAIARRCAEPMPRSSDLRGAGGVEARLDRAARDGWRAPVLSNGRA